MKKLMTVLASTAAALCAFGLSADLTTTGSSIESSDYVVGQNLVSTTTDPDEDEVQRQYWYIATADGGDNGVVVSNYEASATTTPIATRPDKFKEVTNSKFLALDTSSPLYRTALPNTQNPSEFSGATIGTDGIYLDTLVKFTAADDVFGEDALAAGDKIAISYVEREEESTTTEVDGEPVTTVTVAALTNFVIRAGYIESSGRISAKNYEAKLVLPNDAKFNKDVWHRLTVRTVPNIDAAENGNVGFVVYVDETALVYADDDETIGDEVELVGVAATVSNSVFPSAVASAASGGSTITSASFSGTGAIDDVVFTKKMPSFIATSSKIPVTFTIPSGVTSVDVTVGDAQPVSVTAANPTVELEAGTTEFTLAVNIEQGSGYTFTGITGATMDASSNVVTVDGAAMTITINVSRNNFNLFDAIGAPITTGAPFETLSAALAATGVAKIQLAYNYNVVANETVSDSTPVYVISKDIVLDLNGKTLDGGSSNTRFLFSTDTDCSLTVIDSVAGDDGKIIYGGTYGIFGGSGDIYIGSTELTDYGVVVDGSLCGAELGYVTEVVRGKFLASGNTTEGEFVYFQEPEDLLNLKSSAELVNDYWVVTYDGEEQPTTYTVTVTPTANATYAAVIGETDVTFTENVATVNAGSTVVITATASTGYTYTGVEVTGWTPSQDGTTATYTISSIAAAAEVEIPAPTKVVEPDTFDITYSGAANAIVVTDPANLKGLAVNTKVTFTATPNSGYTYEGVTLGVDWVRDSQTGAISYTLTVISEVAVVIPDAVAEQQGGYPTYIDTTDADAKAKYDAWKATYGADTASAYEDAFLLNCAPANVNTEKAAFKFTKIAFEGGVWVTETTTKNTAGDDYNGEVVVTRYSDVGCTTENENGSFFKAELK